MYVNYTVSTITYPTSLPEEKNGGIHENLPLNQVLSNNNLQSDIWNFCILRSEQPGLYSDY